MAYQNDRKVLILGFSVQRGHIKTVQQTIANEKMGSWDSAQYLLKMIGKCVQGDSDKMVHSKHGVEVIDFEPGVELYRSMAFAEQLVCSR